MDEEQRQRYLRKMAKSYLGELIQTGHHEANPDWSFEDLVLSDLLQSETHIKTWMGKEDQYRWVPEMVKLFEEECRQAIRWAMRQRGIVERQQQLFST